jgi:hypothetical protein
LQCTIDEHDETPIPHISSTSRSMSVARGKDGNKYVSRASSGPGGIFERCPDFSGTILSRPQSCWERERRGIRRVCNCRLKQWKRLLICIGH